MLNKHTNSSGHKQGAKKTHKPGVFRELHTTGWWQDASSSQSISPNPQSTLAFGNETQTYKHTNSGVLLIQM